jgi:hypothetical protein
VANRGCSLVAVHRLTGDGNKKTLVSPLWSADKKAVLNSVSRIVRLTERHRGYVFRRIREDEIPVIFSIILSRMRWMDEVGIDQWNNTFYDEVYPVSYYEEHRRAGEVFVLEEISTGEIVSAAVLKCEDDRWEHIEDYHSKKAFYLHNFCSRLDKKGTGKIFLDFAEEYARICEKDVFRLDSADDNKVLEAYYESRGYVPKGCCIDGLYKGILREKEIN